MSFAEESLILLTLDPGEIPRFAQNDTQKGLFPQPVKPAPPKPQEYEVAHSPITDTAQVVPEKSKLIAA